MSRVTRSCVDAGALVLLVAILVAVYWFDRPVPGRDSEQPAEVPTAADPPPKRTPLPLSLAVTPTGFDDKGKLLDTLGAGYNFTVVDEKTLDDPSSCARFDAIFLTCAKTTDLPPGSQLTASLIRKLSLQRERRRRGRAFEHDHPKPLKGPLEAQVSSRSCVIIPTAASRSGSIGG